MAADVRAVCSRIELLAAKTSRMGHEFSYGIGPVYRRQIAFRRPSRITFRWLSRPESRSVLLYSDGLYDLIQNCHDGLNPDSIFDLSKIVGRTLSSSKVTT